jgi:hypothetical protein
MPAARYAWYANVVCNSCLHYICICSWSETVTCQLQLAIWWQIPKPSKLQAMMYAHRNWFQILNQQYPHRSRYLTIWESLISNPEPRFGQTRDPRHPITLKPLDRPDSQYGRSDCGSIDAGFVHFSSSTRCCVACPAIPRCLVSLFLGPSTSPATAPPSPLPCLQWQRQGGMAGAMAPH